MHRPPRISPHNNVRSSRQTQHHLRVFVSQLDQSRLQRQLPLRRFHLRRSGLFSSGHRWNRVRLKRVGVNGRDYVSVRTLGQSKEIRVH